MRRRFPIDTWILLAVVPTLVIVTLVLSLVVYDALYAQILEGFDRKLVAACSVTSSFIDGDDHASLLEPIPMHALSWDVAADRLAGADADGRVYAIDVITGEANPLGSAPIGRFDAWAIAGERLFLLVDDGRTLVERAWPPQEGETPAVRTRLGRESALMAIAWHGDRLTGVATDLTEIHLTRQGPARRVIGGLPPGPPVRAATWAGGKLLLLRSDETSCTIVQLSPEGRAVDSVASVRTEGGALRRALALASDGSRVWAATREGLVEWTQPPSGETGRAEGFASGFRSRNDPLYLHYVRPMRALMRKQKLTYCYSQIVLDESRIAYVLDASEGDDQALIGGVDVVPKEDMLATRQVMKTGQVLVGGVRRFERWGLLKVSTGPIRDSAGRVSATAGVDVNISTIREKTRTVLVQVLALGFFGLLLATAVSFALARRLTRPLQEIKAAALKVAAGRHGLAVAITRPSELRELATAFNTLSRQTRETLERLEQRRRQFERTRLRQVLASRLRRQPAGPVIEESYDTGGDGLINESGHCHAHERTFVWLTDDARRDPEASRHVAVTRELASRALSALSGEAPGVVLASLLALVATPRAALVEHGTGEVVWHATDGAPAPTADERGVLAFSSPGAGTGYRLLLQVRA